MKSRLVAMLLIVCGSSLAAGEFRYEVKRDKLWRSERGVLTVNEQGVQYRSENGKTALDFAFGDIRKADVSDPRKVRLYTYDRAKMRLTQPREHEFQLREGTTSGELTQFLAEHLQRPILGAYELANSGPEIPAYHRHALGGCHGVVRFGPLAIQFESKDPKHSRTWLYEDVQTIGTMDVFHFRLTTFQETYNFDLKERLPEDEYRLLWERLYGVNPSPTKRRALARPAGEWECLYSWNGNARWIPAMGNSGEGIRLSNPTLQVVVTCEVQTLVKRDEVDCFGGLPPAAQSSTLPSSESHTGSSDPHFSFSSTGSG